MVSGVTCRNTISPLYGLLKNIPDYGRSQYHGTMSNRWWVNIAEYTANNEKKLNA
jgi:hypothetical protein